MIYFLSKIFEHSRIKRIVKPSVILRTMSSRISTEGLPLKQIVTALKAYADTSFAESWDNVGLLIEPSEPKNVSHILLTNDLTENVMQEAVDLNVDMIISYHPPIFAPLKRINASTWKVLTFFKLIYMYINYLLNFTIVKSYY